jgi:trk/ktr system potassium uptake protein
VHVVVLGSGRVGSELASRLDSDGHSVAIIDKNPRAFSRLPVDFGGKKVEGIGFDRDILEEAGILDAGAFAAVSSGDNSNIVAARIAREHYNIPQVVARIADPRRAELYERLGITTVAAVRWQARRIALRLLGEPDEQWSDSGGDVVLMEINLPTAWAGRPLGELEVPGLVRLVAVRRAGRGKIGDPGALAQEGDAAVLCVAGGDRSVVNDVLFGPGSQAGH